MKTVAIIGASTDRSKFGNKSVRAHLNAGYKVYPVHPKEKSIEGQPAYKSILDVPPPLDRVSLYLPPSIGVSVLADVAKMNPTEVWVNPGAGSAELFKEGKRLNLKLIDGCSIVDIGESPGDYR